jgi:hypothetical protein
MSTWSAYDPYDPTQPIGTERVCNACGVVVTDRDLHNQYHDWVQQQSRGLGHVLGEDSPSIDPPPTPEPVPDLCCPNGHSRKDIGESQPLCRRCFQPMTPCPPEGG